MTDKTKRFLIKSATETVNIAALFVIFYLAGVYGLIGAVIGTVLAVATVVYYIEPKIEQWEADIDG